MKTYLKTVVTQGGWLLAGLLVFGHTAESQAAILFTGSIYSQNFDTLTTSATTGQTWANDGAPTPTLAGWSLFRQNGANAPVALTTFAGGTGSGNGGSFYSFGAAASTERALGGLGSGGAYFGSPGDDAVAGWMAVALQNTSFSTFDSFTLKFVGEQWRNGGNTSPQTMALQYGFGATFGTVASWITPGGAFNYVSPVTGATASAVNGNSTAVGGGKVLGLGGTISSLAWLNNEILWIRWIEKNDTGTDHGLAIDDFSITATKVPVPEPSTFIAGALLALPFGLQGVRYLRNRKQVS